MSFQHQTREAELEAAAKKMTRYLKRFGVVQYGVAIGILLLLWGITSVRHEYLAMTISSTQACVAPHNLPVSHHHHSVVSAPTPTPSPTVTPTLSPTATPTPSPSPSPSPTAKPTPTPTKSTAPVTSSPSPKSGGGSLPTSTPTLSASSASGSEIGGLVFSPVTFTVSNATAGSKWTLEPDNNANACTVATGATSCTIYLTTGDGNLSEIALPATATYSASSGNTTTNSVSVTWNSVTPALLSYNGTTATIEVIGGVAGESVAVEATSNSINGQTLYLGPCTLDSAGTCLLTAAVGAISSSLSWGFTAYPGSMSLSSASSAGMMSGTVDLTSSQLTISTSATTAASGGTITLTVGNVPAGATVTIVADGQQTSDQCTPPTGQTSCSVTVTGASNLASAVQVEYQAWVSWGSASFEASTSEVVTWG